MERALLQAFLEEGLSLDAIAEEVGRAPSTISYWLSRHGLVANGAARFGTKEALPEETIARLAAEGKSVPAIAEEIASTPDRVRRSLARLGLATRGSTNRAAARQATANGYRYVDLVCLHHGSVRHILEGRGSYRCVLCRAEQVAEHRRKVKRLLISEAGGCCRICGYDRCEAALHFHHLVPAEKSFHLSLRGITRSIEKVREEASKCILLCATCHAEVEVGYVEVP